MAYGRDFRQKFMAKLYFVCKTGAATVAKLIEQQHAICQQQIADFRTQLAAMPAERGQILLSFIFALVSLKQGCSGLIFVSRCSL